MKNADGLGFSEVLIGDRIRQRQATHNRFDFSIRPNRTRSAMWSIVKLTSDSGQVGNLRRDHPHWLGDSGKRRIRENPMVVSYVPQVVRTISWNCQFINILSDW